MSRRNPNDVRDAFKSVKEIASLENMYKPKLIRRRMPDHLKDVLSNKEISHCVRSLEKYKVRHRLPEWVYRGMDMIADIARNNGLKIEAKTVSRGNLSSYYILLPNGDVWRVSGHEIPATIQRDGRSMIKNGRPYRYDKGPQTIIRQPITRSSAEKLVRNKIAQSQTQ